MTDIVERLDNLIQCEMDEAQCELYATAKSKIDRLQTALQQILEEAPESSSIKTYARRGLDEGLPTAEDVRGIMRRHAPSVFYDGPSQLTIEALRAENARLMRLVSEQERGERNRDLKIALARAEIDRLRADNAEAHRKLDAIAKHPDVSLLIKQYASGALDGLKP